MHCENCATGGAPCDRARKQSRKGLARPTAALYGNEQRLRPAGTAVDGVTASPDQGVDRLSPLQGINKYWGEKSGQVLPVLSLSRTDRLYVSSAGWTSD